MASRDTALRSIRELVQEDRKKRRKTAKLFKRGKGPYFDSKNKAKADAAFNAAMQKVRRDMQPDTKTARPRTAAARKRGG